MPADIFTPKPSWLKTSIPGGALYRKVVSVIKKYHLNTVCESAACPNRAECWGDNGCASILILGSNCTRNCQFCNVETAVPQSINTQEPAGIAAAVNDLSLAYVIITSVTRDDLSDGGAGQWAATISHIIRECSQTKVEVLVPDFSGDINAHKKIIACQPAVYGHNIETVQSLYSAMRPHADYRQSLFVLKKVKEIAPSLITKSAVMVGLGESYTEIKEVLSDLLLSRVDIVHIGQYLQPSRKHAPVQKYYHPDEFHELEVLARQMGFKAVQSAPLVRSSYNAEASYRSIVQ